MFKTSSNIIQHCEENIMNGHVLRVTWKESWMASQWMVTQRAISVDLTGHWIVREALDVVPSRWVAVEPFGVPSGRCAVGRGLGGCIGHHRGSTRGPPSAGGWVETGRLRRTPYPPAGAVAKEWESWSRWSVEVVMHCG